MQDEVKNIKTDWQSYIKEHGECVTGSCKPEIQTQMMEVNDNAFRERVIQSMQAVDENPKNTSPEFAYGSETLIPGKPIDIDNLRATSNKDITKVAEETLITRAASAKLEKERQRQLKRPMDERVKEVYIQSLINQQKTLFLEENGYCMSGKQLRHVTRQIEQKYKMKKLRPSKEEYNAIVDYLNSPLSDPNPVQQPQRNSTGANKLNIGNLISSI